MAYFLRITPSRDQNSSFHVIDTRADQIFDQRPFLNRVGKQTITMGFTKNKRIRSL
jgi:hypothetical protein